MRMSKESSGFLFKEAELQKFIERLKDRQKGKRYDNKRTD